MKFIPENWQLESLYTIEVSISRCRLVLRERTQRVSFPQERSIGMSYENEVGQLVAVDVALESMRDSGYDLATAVG